MKTIPSLSKEHKSNRNKFASENVSWGRRFKKVIVSGEKQFNLDGPDGF